MFYEVSAVIVATLFGLATSLQAENSELCHTNCKMTCKIRYVSREEEIKEHVFGDIRETIEKLNDAIRKVKILFKNKNGKKCQKVCSYLV